MKNLIKITSVIIFGIIYFQYAIPKDNNIIKDSIISKYKLNELNQFGWEDLTVEQKIKRVNSFKALRLEQELPVFSEKDFPAEGLVKDEATAIKIAEIYWLNLYDSTIYRQKPFFAILINNKIWRVSGILQPDYLGGTIVMDIQKIDGKVICIGYDGK